MLKYATSGRYVKKAPANLPRGPSNQRLQNRNLVEMGLVRLGPVHQEQGKKKVVNNQRMKQFTKKGVVYTPVVANSQGPIEFQRIDGKSDQIYYY